MAIPGIIHQLASVPQRSIPTLLQAHFASNALQSMTPTSSESQHPVHHAPAEMVSSGRLQLLEVVALVLLLDSFKMESAIPV
jgi:hypothetical protein